MKQWNPGEGGGPNTHLISMKRNKQIFVRFQLLRCLRCRIAAGYYSKDAESKCLGLSRKKRGRPHTPGCPLPLLSLSLLILLVQDGKKTRKIFWTMYLFSPHFGIQVFTGAKSEVRKIRNLKSEKAEIRSPKNEYKNQKSKN